MIAFFEFVIFVVYWVVGSLVCCTWLVAIFIFFVLILFYWVLFIVVFFLSVWQVLGCSLVVNTISYGVWVVVGSC